MSLCVRAGRTVQYSDDSEAGDGQRKKFRLSREEEETEAGSGGVMVKKKKKKKKKSWNDSEPSTSHGLEVVILACACFDVVCCVSPVFGGIDSVFFGGVEGEACSRV